MESPATTYWEETSSIHSNLKYERCGSNSVAPSPRSCKEEQHVYRYCETNGGNLNFTTAATSEDDEYTYHKKKISRDPMSHRIIEKRRRDRMNNCLADLSRLIPADYLKKGRGRIEKTEIIEMAIKHMKYLQAHVCSHVGSDGYSVERRPATPHPHPECDESSLSPPDNLGKLSSVTEHYRLGFHECLSETMHFLVEVEGFYAGDSLCVSLISHLQKHCDNIIKSDRLNSLNEPSQPSSHCGESTSTSSPGSSGGGKAANDHGSSSSSEGGSSAVCGRSTDDLYDVQGSQLRDILTSPSSNHSIARLQLGVESPSPSTSLNGSSTADHHISSGSLYKFKNNIKQRFSAEHSDRNVIVSDGLVSQRPPSAASSIAGKRRHSVEMQQPGSDFDAPSPHQRPFVHSQSVPIFALHSRGSYYIPLTVDHDALSPFLNDVSLDSHPNLSSLVLHPVTISVNFHQPKVHCNHNASNNSNNNNNNNNNNINSNNNNLSSVNGWNLSQIQPATVNSFLPIPKWAAACTPERS